jgi:aspartate carbamoyltransferase catalytic subunit
MTLFYENSTRTRVSFESAVNYLGGHPITITAATSSVQKGESLIDTGKNLDAMGTDVIVIRHPMSGAPHLMAQNVEAAVVNGGDGMNEHPTQALLDMYTMREKFGTLKGLKVAIIGDIFHSRVARSNMWGLQKMGATVTMAAPATLLPPELEKTGIQVFTSVEEAMKDADVVMGLRIQTERQKSGLFPSIGEYVKFFGINKDRMKLAKPNAILMHPGPINQGVEIAADITGGEQSVILEQVTNGVAVRMAVLALLTGRE